MGGEAPIPRLLLRVDGNTLSRHRPLLYRHPKRKRQEAEASTFDDNPVRSPLHFMAPPTFVKCIRY